MLRRDELAGDIVYEMAHEALIEEIRGWFDETDLRHKQAEEMLARDVANWRIDGTPIPEARLERLHEHREAIVGVDNDTSVCLLHSAVAAEFQVEDWPAIAANRGQPGHWDSWATNARLSPSPPLSRIKIAACARQSPLR